MSINNELLTKFWGKCWHQWSIKGEYDRCIHCKELVPEGDNPDFTDDHTMLDFLRWFWKEKSEMWDKFEEWGWDRGIKDCYYDGRYAPWLFSLDNSEPRIMSLLSDWLSLPETREKWGWVECPQLNCMSAECKENPECGGNGKLGADWAKEE